jgi:Cu/Ag efflux protein CusF
MEDISMNRLPKLFLVVLALAFLLGLTTTAFAAEAKGKIKTINSDKHEFVLTDDTGKDMTFSLSDEAKIRLNDKASRLDDLKTGDEVTVVFDRKDDKLMATEVRCERK